jgi:hypothetical protein
MIRTHQHAPHREPRRKRSAKPAGRNSTTRSVITFVSTTFAAQLVYKRPEQTAAVVKLLEQALQHRADIVKLPATPQRTARALLDLAATFKDDAFQHEEEWRIVISNVIQEEQAVEFAVNAGRLRPYISLQMPGNARLPICEVLVLAHGQPEQSLKATRLALKKYQYSPDLASLSRVPFLG